VIGSDLNIERLDGVIVFLYHTNQFQIMLEKYIPFSIFKVKLPGPQIISDTMETPFVGIVNTA